MGAQQVEQIVFEVANVLRIPVLVLALLSVLAVLADLGVFAVELVRRRRRQPAELEGATRLAQKAMAEDNASGALDALRAVAWSASMGASLSFIVAAAQAPNARDRLAKALADFDFRSLKRLERTRLLVRAGPALGLMGTLIPLSPALAGLASGNVEALSSNLRVAFSVTVLGLLVGAVAFGISLVRDRLYGQDLSDLEYVVSVLAPGAPPVAEPVSTPASG